MKIYLKICFCLILIEKTHCATCIIISQNLKIVFIVKTVMIFFSIKSLPWWNITSNARERQFHYSWGIKEKIWKERNSTTFECRRRRLEKSKSKLLLSGKTVMMLVNYQESSLHFTLKELRFWRQWIFHVDSQLLQGKRYFLLGKITAKWEENKASDTTKISTDYWISTTTILNTVWGCNTHWDRDTLEGSE